MKFEIIGGSFPAAEVTLNQGESVITQSGAMAWSDSTVEMSTNAEGGFLKSLGRMFSGASLMFVTHTATKDDSKVTFSASFPGSFMYLVCAYVGVIFFSVIIFLFTVRLRAGRISKMRSAYGKQGRKTI